MKIIIADDHQIITDGLLSILNQIPETEVVGSVSNGKEVLDLLKKEPADIVIMDINMPEMDGIQATKLIKKNYPKVKVLILSMYDKEGFIKNTIEVGADGYVLKNTGKDELITAIEYISSGRTYFSQEVTQTLVHQMRTAGSPEGVHISPKEKDILELMAEGLTSHEIAEKISASYHTVETHRKNLLIKFDAKNASVLIKKAMDKGFIA